jgi:carbamoyltransferase
VNILSFTYWNGCHDTSAAIVCDGMLVAAAEEERFTRHKHDGRFPLNAIDFCLRKAGIKMEDVDVLAFPGKPFRSGVDSQLAEIDFDSLRQLVASGEARYRTLLHKHAMNAYLKIGRPFNWSQDRTIASGFKMLRQHYSCVPPIRFYSHHLSHAAAAYFTSGQNRAAVATIDGRGDPFSTVTWIAQGKTITRLQTETANNSLGLFYRDCTRYLGLGDFGEGKTMGLAAYGSSKTFNKQLAIMLDVGDRGWYRYSQIPNDALLGFAQRREEPIQNPIYADFSAAMQTALECAVGRVVRSVLLKAETNTLCLGGGVALNCASNGQILASGLSSSVWVFPAAGDAGLSVGAGLLCAAEAGELVQRRLDHAYFGPDFTSFEYEATLSEEPGLTFYRAHDLSKEVADSLLAGEVIGWFQGRMELGPRALGNRSILADPRRAEMRDRVNTLKGRELWRPLGPVVLEEKAHQFFTLTEPSPFMLFAVQVRPEVRHLVPAIVHVDGSARPQTVRRDQNARLYDLIERFSRSADTPVLINTSFNAAGEPNVCTPRDAVRTFKATGLDVLVLGDYVVRRRHGV